MFCHKFNRINDRKIRGTDFRQARNDGLQTKLFASLPVICPLENKKTIKGVEQLNLEVQTMKKITHKHLE